MVLPYYFHKEKKMDFQPNHCYPAFGSKYDGGCHGDLIIPQYIQRHPKLPGKRSLVCTCHRISDLPYTKWLVTLHTVTINTDKHGDYVDIGDDRFYSSKVTKY